MIVVTGGLGFIGNELVRQLKKNGEEVAIIDNKNRVAPHIEDILTDTPVFEVDITDAQALKQILEEYKPDQVIHLAAIHFIPECNENPERTLRVNVEGTSAVIRAAKHCGTRRLIFASSGAVYDDVPSGLQEDSPIAPVDVYGYSKLFGEGLCRLHAETNFEVVACRLFNNYGPRETNPHIIPEILHQLSDGNSVLHLGNIQPVRDYIHTSDAAQAIIKLIDVNLPSAFTPLNICTGQGHSVESLIKIFSELLNRDIQVEKDMKRFRKVDKMVQLGVNGSLQAITGWMPQWEMRDGLENLLRFEKLL
ncbi:MAG: NAD-dependent epimerase/dehydratase family protein [Flavobacteriaceae bacterium]|nr:NAD-dependent epimerase/dehydratase family protein [Flavobacteriaceae bacterium]